LDPNRPVHATRDVRRDPVTEDDETEPLTIQLFPR
jgi:hypothetical protein